MYDTYITYPNYLEEAFSMYILIVSLADTLKKTKY